MWTNRQISEASSEQQACKVADLGLQPASVGYATRPFQSHGHGRQGILRLCETYKASFIIGWKVESGCWRLLDISSRRELYIRFTTLQIDAELQRPILQLICCSQRVDSHRATGTARLNSSTSWLIGLLFLGSSDGTYGAASALKAVGQGAYSLSSCT